MENEGWDLVGMLEEIVMGKLRIGGGQYGEVPVACLLEVVLSFVLR